MPGRAHTPAWRAALSRALQQVQQQQQPAATVPACARLQAAASSAVRPAAEHAHVLHGALVSAARAKPAGPTCSQLQQQAPNLAGSGLTDAACAGALSGRCSRACCTSPPDHRSCHGSRAGSMATQASTCKPGLLTLSGTKLHPRQQPLPQPHHHGLLVHPAGAPPPPSAWQWTGRGLGTALWQAERARCFSAQPAEKQANEHEHTCSSQGCSHHSHPTPTQPDATQLTPTASPTRPHTSPTPSPSSLASSQAAAPSIVGVSTLQSGAGFKKTFYKRHLPSPPAIAFASPEGKQLFAEALADGTMSGFFKLVEQFSTQDEPAFCGLTSLSMVLNALSIDPRRTWKGAWRWFHEGMLDCCRPLDTVRRDGITLIQAAVLARCNGARVDMRRYGSFTEQEFRAQVEEVCTSGEEHLVVSYSRRAFNQTGDGHFSPVGGYHRARDLVLILDVARFKYPPHWVSLPMLYEAMSRPDPVTGLPRGYLLMSAHHLLDSAMFTLDVRQEGWQRARSYAAAMPSLLQQQLAAGATGVAGACAGDGAGTGSGSVGYASAGAASLAGQPQQPRSHSPAATHSATPGATPGTTPAAAPPPSPAVTSALRQLLQDLPLDSAMLFVVVREQVVGPADRCVPHGARDALLTEMRGLPLYQLVADTLRDKHAAASHTRLSMATSTAAATTINSSAASHPASATHSLPSPDAASSATSAPNTIAAVVPGAVRQVAWSQCGSGESYLAERVTLLLLLLPTSAWPDADAWGSEEAAAQWRALMDLTSYSIVATEVAYLRQQFVNVEQVLQSGSVEATCGEPACTNKLDCAAHGHA